MKKIILLISFIPIFLFSQDWEGDNIYVRESLYLKGSTVDSITPGDTIATTRYVDEHISDSSLYADTAGYALQPCKLHVNISKDGNITSFNTLVTLTAYVNETGITYNWDGGAGSNKTLITPTTGNHNVVVSKSGCINDTAEIYIVDQTDFHENYNIELPPYSATDTVLSKNYHPGLSSIDTSSAFTATELLVATGSTTAESEDSLTWSGGELTVTGNTDLDGILFTGSTKTAGAFDIGSTNPSNTNRINWDGNFYTRGLRVGNNDYTPAFGTNNPFVYSSDSYPALFYCTNERVITLYNSGALTTDNSYSLFDLRRTTSGNYNITGSIISITDNPTGSGTRNYKTFSATIGSTERIAMNPRVSSGTSNEAYLWDTHNPLTGAKHNIWANQGDTLMVLDSISLRVKNIFSVQDSLIVYPDSSTFTGYHVADSFVMTDRTVVSDFVFEKGYNYGSFWEDLQYAMQNKTLPSLKSHSRNLATRQENTIESLERLYLQMADELKKRDKEIARLEKKIDKIELLKNEKLIYALIIILFGLVFILMIKKK